MTPTEAGFDGARGVYLTLPCPEYPNGIIYHLLRGRTHPEKLKSLSNQFAWLYPEGEEPKLLYANKEGELFELGFTPYTVAEQ
jgi:hypothetical protein